MRYAFVLSLAFGLVTAVALSETPRAQSPLADYVAKADPSYRWVQKRTGQLLSASYAELILTSQTWRDITWKHQLFVIKPYSMDKNPQHALLFITGGNWRDELETARRSIKPDEANLYVSLAELIHAPVAVLCHVPHQPIFDGKTEDGIIAYTFEEFLKTGDSQWPLLLPMVKSAVRGMDAVQEFARQEWSLEVKTFTVTGASKRGWTTWLTGATDPRATAIAPMVIDMLNMTPQLDHQERTWGSPSDKIHDYTERGLHQQLRTEKGERLQTIVDPYRYRERLTQPKLIILGTNDPYWPLDAANLYWSGLAGEKYLLYVPNNGHGLRDYGRVFNSLNALHQHVANGRRLPKLTWEFAQRDQTLRLNVRSEPAAARVVAWVSRADTRDFRESPWRSSPTQGCEAQAVFELPVPERGFAAVFAEAEYAPDDSPYSFCTNVRIVGTADR